MCNEITRSNQEDPGTSRLGGDWRGMSDIHPDLRSENPSVADQRARPQEEGQHVSRCEHHESAQNNRRDTTTPSDSTESPGKLLE